MAKPWRRKGMSRPDRARRASRVRREARRQGAAAGAPVESRPICGEIDMRIAADGTWFYLKTPIGRPALVKLFASVLKREGDKYFLVTPVEKMRHHGRRRAVHWRSRCDWMARRRRRAACSASAPMSTTGSACGPDHPLRFEPEAETGGLKPYLHVRRDLWAQGDARAVL